MSEAARSILPRQASGEIDPAGSTATENHLELTAVLAERDTLRYNLSGVPVTECVLTHASQCPEAGIERRVDLQIQAVAIGDVARQLAGIAPGVQLRVGGFLAQARRSTRLVCLHLTRIDQY